MSTADEGVRASDADRERVAGELNVHAAAGRLTPEELEERVEAAYSARTLGELRPLTADLPAAAAVPVKAVSPEREIARRRLAHLGGVAAMSIVVCVAIWAASGAHHGSFWPIWVIIAWAVALARDGWRSLGPGAELTDEQLGRRSRARRLPPGG